MSAAPPASGIATPPARLARSAPHETCLGTFDHRLQRPKRIVDDRLHPERALPCVRSQFMAFGAGGPSADVLHEHIRLLDVVRDRVDARELPVRADR